MHTAGIEQLEGRTHGKISQYGSIFGQPSGGVQSQVDALNSSLAKLYPVGSIYISVNDTNPGTFIGGTWEQICGRFLVGTGWIEANSTDYFGPQGANTICIPAGEMGGEAWHTLTVDQMPSHEHRDMMFGGNSGDYFGVNQGAQVNPGFESKWNFSYTSGTGQAYLYTARTGNSAAHNNMPPYLSVFMWKRIA